MLSVQKRKFEPRRIDHIRISLGAKFHLKPTINIFKTKFAQKGYFLSKAGQMNNTIEFSLFELVWVPTLSQSDSRS